MKKPIVSIIISVRDDKRIINCLNSIFNLGILEFNESFEVIVIENSTIPSLKKDICEFPVKYFFEPKLGMGYARNTGLANATGDFFVFTDADCVVSPGWLSNILKAFNEDSVCIVGGCIFKYNPQSDVENFQRDLVIGCQTEVQYLPPIYHKPYVVTANAAYRASAIRAVGGFDPNFFSGGDVDLAWRVGNLGYRAVIAESAIVYHACRPTYTAVFKQFYTYSQGHALLFKKFRTQTGKIACFNWYPFIGIVNTLPLFILITIKYLLNKEYKEEFGNLLFRFIEYTALIWGAFIGAIKYKVPYI
ncbi:glycosyltransferase family 2 protein [Nostoc sp.]|uniref:glycosyltransferase family 2 protein n=1 Tax=Nostoc sp. TaxID=1180 RepID=UPI002FFC3D46